MFPSVGQERSRSGSREEIVGFRHKAEGAPEEACRGAALLLFSLPFVMTSAPFESSCLNQKAVRKAHLQTIVPRGNGSEIPGIHVVENLVFARMKPP